MMKSGAPPDKVRVLYTLLPIEFHGFKAELISKAYLPLVPGLISIFLETVWVPLTESYTEKSDPLNIKKSAPSYMYRCVCVYTIRWCKPSVTVTLVITHTDL